MKTLIAWLLALLSPLAFALDKNVTLTYGADGSATVDLSAAPWADKYLGAEVLLCKTETVCDPYQSMGTAKTFQLTTPGVYFVSFLASWTYGNGPDFTTYVAYEQRITVLDSVPADLLPYIERHKPLLSFADGEEYGPVSIDTLFDRWISDFQVVRLVGSPSYRADEKVNDLMRVNANFRNKVFMRPEIASALAGDQSLFPMYWFAQRVSDTKVHVTYFVLYGFDKKGNLSPFNHELDRESVTITFGKAGPQWSPETVTYAGHLPDQDTIFRGCDNLATCGSGGTALARWTGGRTSVAWASASRQGERPIAYVAKGSHAMKPGYGWYEIVNALGPSLVEKAGNSVLANLASPSLERLDLSLPQHSALVFSGLLVNPFYYLNYLKLDVPGVMSRFFPHIRNPIGDWLASTGTAFSECVRLKAGCESYVVAVDPPSITSVVISPAPPLVGSQAIFSVNGVNLQGGYLFSFPGCVPVELASASTVLRQFSCSPTEAGFALAGSVSQASGPLIYSFTSDVLRPSPGAQIATVVELKNSFARTACQPAAGTGSFSSLVEYRACGPDVVGDFELAFGQCVLRKSGAIVTLSAEGGAAGSISATLNQTYSSSSSTSGDAVYIGRPDPSYEFGSDESFNLFVGDFIDTTYVNINLRTDGSAIVSLSAQDFARNKTISCNVSEPPPVEPPPSGSSKLNDSGITADKCYAAGVGPFVNCSSAEAIALYNKQDGMVGRDAAQANEADGRAGFSFSLVAKPNGGFFDKTECIKDNVTGLTWEGKTADSGPRPFTRKYTNLDISGFTDDSAGHINALRSQQLCGYTDWRVPTLSELQSILDFGVASPALAIDTVWFPNTADGFYWTSFPFAASPASTPCIRFGGIFRGDCARDNYYHLRLVR